MYNSGKISPSGRLRQWQSEAKIWKILPDTGKDSLILELRTTQEKRLELARIELQVPERGLMPMPIDLIPRSMLLAVQDGMLLLSHYPDINLPLLSGLRCYDWVAEAWRWQITEEGEPGEIAQEGIEYLQGGDRVYLDWRTGTQIPKIKVSTPLSYGLHFPEMLAPLSPGYQSVIERLPHTLPKIAPYPVAYSQFGDWELLAFAQLTETGLLDIHLSILQQGVETYTELLHSQRARMIRDPFMLLGERVLFLTGDQQLSAYRLD